MSSSTATTSDASTDRLRSVLRTNLAEGIGGCFSVCSAHPTVIRSTLRLAKVRKQIAVVEATSNQVNQFGGYTGLTPEEFAQMVFELAELEDFPCERILLGGDHLGPQPWRRLNAADAMQKAEAMVADYVRAGFTKIHLDCSMTCADDPPSLTEQEIAERAVSLAAAAEQAAAEIGRSPLYVIGTEVPPPGGMGSGHEIVPTDPEHVETTWSLHRGAFFEADLSEAFDRVIAMVVQPGLDFSNETVVDFDDEHAMALSATVATMAGAVFEAHSTDYQRPLAYRQLVSRHFAILKVGPAATFAMREALYSLEMIATELFYGAAPSGLRAALEVAMLADPGNWSQHYSGDERQLAYLRHFSFSDRLRYYWTVPSVQAAVDRLMTQFEERDIPRPLISQYLPQLFDEVAEGRISCDAESLIIANIMRALAAYADASGPHFID